MTTTAANPIKKLKASEEQPAYGTVKVRELGDALHAFLAQTASAFKAIEDQESTLAQSTIAQLSDEIPEWVAKFKAEFAPRLNVMFSPAEVKAWVADLDSAATAAAHQPKRLFADNQMMADWLRAVSNPLRKLMREFNALAERQRRLELSSLPKKATPDIQKSTQPGSTDMQKQLLSIIEKKFPSLANRYGQQDKTAEDTKTKQWVNEQMSGLKRAKREDIKVPEGEKIVLFTASVLAAMNVDVRTQQQLKSAGFKIKFVTGWANIQNAMVVGIAGTQDVNQVLKHYKTMMPESKIAKANMHAYPQVHKYKGYRYYLVLPIVKSGLSLDEWHFAL